MKHVKKWQSESNIEALARAKRNDREALERKHTLEQKQQREKERLPQLIQKRFDELCELANEAHRLLAKDDNLRNQLYEFISHNKALDNPTSPKVIFWMLCLFSIPAIALIDYFLLNGFSTYLISVGGATIQEYLVLLKIAIVLALIWLEIIIGSRLIDEQGHLPWHAFTLSVVIAAITGITFIASVGGLDVIDLLLALQIGLVVIVAFICHALCIRIASTILLAIAWLKYKRLRRKTAKNHVKVLSATNPVYSKYLSWRRLFVQNNLDPPERDLPRHVVIVLEYYKGRNGLENTEAEMAR